MMRNRMWIAFVLAAVSTLGSCAGRDGEEGTVNHGGANTVASQAAERAAEFKAALMAALKEGLAEGPEHAIGACSVRAPELAAEMSVDGFRIGRTSLKLRNPDNAPEPWLEPLLAEYQAAGPGAEPRSVRIDDETLGYVEPLYVAEPCLTCHGELVDDLVWQELAELYPDDAATGYRAGDFRGLLWVTAPAGPIRPRPGS